MLMVVALHTMMRMETTIALDLDYIINNAYIKSLKSFDLRLLSFYLILSLFLLFQVPITSLTVDTVTKASISLS